MKTLFIFLVLVFIHLTATSQLITEEKELKIDNDGWHYKNEKPYNGLVISRFNNQQIKSIFEVKNGVLFGFYKTFYLDSAFSTEKFQDTLLLTKLLVEKSLIDEEYSNSTKDTVESNNQLSLFILEDAGGVKKWEKIQAKANDGNLKDDSKTLWDKGQSLIKNHKDKKEIQQKKLGNLQVLATTIEREKLKQVHVGIIAEIENYQGSGSDPKRIVGPYTAFHKNGKKKMIKIYVPLSITHFDQNENKLLEEIDGEKRFYINNLLSSVVTENKKTSYQDGKINRIEYKLPNENRSIDSIFYENGKISKVEEFLENKKSKTSLFNELGILTQTTSFYDVLNLESNYDHNTGETIKRDDEAHNKQETLFYENGYKKLETTYFNDLKNGLEIAYYETGNLERETTYLKGKKHKNEILYWNHTTKEPKQILNEEYATEIEKSRRNADKKNIETYNYGSLTERNLYDSLGRKKQMNSIKNNKNQGTFELYYPSGSLKSKGNIDTLSNAQDHFFGDYFEYHEQGYYKGSQWVQDVLMHLYYRMDGKVINKRSHPFYFGEKFAEDIIGNPFILGNIEVAEYDLPVEELSYNEAQKACLSLGEGWRLPTKNELMLIYDSLRLTKRSIFHDGKFFKSYMSSEIGQTEGSFERFVRQYNGEYKKEIVHGGKYIWHLTFGAPPEFITTGCCEDIYASTGLGRDGSVLDGGVRAVRTIKK